MAEPHDPAQVLRSRLDDPLPDRLWSLPDDQLADLAAALDDAHAHQSAALDHSIDQALRFIPWPLRVVVRKVLLG
ncbi:MAG TPA: hypothetical protein VFR49_10120 [Solirubrobacteraceae bacterium]|nr:hypothetical protein [Solirubrobacteraceae bacterium]